MWAEEGGGWCRGSGYVSIMYDVAGVGGGPWDYVCILLL